MQKWNGKDRLRGFLAGRPNLRTDELQRCFGRIRAVAVLYLAVMNAIRVRDGKFGRLLVACNVGALLATVTEVDDEVNRNEVVSLEVSPIPVL